MVAVASSCRGVRFSVFGRDGGSGRRGRHDGGRTPTASDFAMWPSTRGGCAPPLPCAPCAVSTRVALVWYVVVVVEDLHVIYACVSVHHELIYYTVYSKLRYFFACDQRSGARGFTVSCFTSRLRGTGTVDR